MNAPRLTLPDPRQYHPARMESNRLLHYTTSVLSAASDAAARQAREDLVAVLGEMLERDEMLAISVALAMAPSQEGYKILWQALRQAVETPAGRHAVVFAVPLVLVVGTKNKATLPDRIADVDGLNALLREHGVFRQGAEVFLSGKLLHPDALVGISAGQLYRYTRQLVDAARGLPLDLQAAPIVAKEEGVFLRYLVGVAIQEEDDEPAVSLGGGVGSWGMPLMKFLAEALKTEGVTLFPIARPPLPVMQAIVAGNTARLEVALQVFASTQIRKLRETGQQPVAIASAHESGELHFTLSSSGDERNWEGFVWPLSALDSVPLIESNFRQLMAECRVEDVRVLERVQPDERNGIPLFFTADDVPADGQPPLQ
ncbi:hypothetical protein [Gulbenkiania mobilis]|uniref:Uncharacterized protein n=1 Tax=Gulbenkiania mobilis TaxID=397457 RepID=A0ABY2D0E2_GULMO|nr:hypothetical protein EV669_101296 [Gulbenkiania mobilis]